MKEVKNINIFTTLWTLIYKEIRRFMRIWIQTLVPPAVTMSLYFVIFGSLIGPRIGEMDGLDYVQFMIPGLIMMSVITNSYANVVSSFYGVKFQKSIEELLISPMPNWAILLGFVIILQSLFEQTLNCGSKGIFPTIFNKILLKTF